MGTVGRFFRSPAGWPLCGLVTVLCIALLESESIPMGRVFNAIGATLLLFVCGIVWLLRLVIAAVLRRRTPIAEQAPFRWRRWLAPPAIVAVTAALLTTEAPLRVRFALSRGALDRLARAVRDEEPSPPTYTRSARHQPKRVGLFDAVDVERTPTGMRFRVPGSGFLVGGGFAWDPEYRPSRRGNDLYRRLDGPWLVWTHDPF